MWDGIKAKVGDPLGAFFEKFKEHTWLEFIDGELVSFTWKPGTFRYEYRCHEHAIAGANWCLANDVAPGSSSYKEFLEEIKKDVARDIKNFRELKQP